MGKFDDFDIDLKENKNNEVHAEPRKTGGEICFSVTVSLQACTTVMSKVTCGESGNCNITKISKCTGR
ncbi:TPA: hypothetical protein KOS81_000075 [Clostridioides difficile]|uniref:hypothetical protein n=1 Tax=Clostridioides difficile TaxID=1496 RepID=UPI001C1A7A5E|nr:hypothetical protein [Clostridioides difficile]MBY2232414.1 hypothetical protein [Clostridioides difficile]MCW0824047.1 hypothetical protein [Clostridioides difficile]HBF6273170.1 hypothetical protein [Clostridioides difficile]HBY3543750.1 hypothetical protein [Clostridioides difficile]